MIHNEDVFRAKVFGWMRGHQDAVDLIVALHHIVETWDDLVDKDAEVPSDGINRAFHAALVDIPRNRFYQDHFALLNPIIESAILDWYAANDCEKAKNYETAWALANDGLSVAVMCARIIGGTEWARTVSVEIRAITKSLSDFKSERTNGVD